jgi:hypothetical protein
MHHRLPLGIRDPHRPKKLYTGRNRTQAINLRAGVVWRESDKVHITTSPLAKKGIFGAKPATVRASRLWVENSAVW